MHWYGDFDTIRHDSTCQSMSLTQQLYYGMERISLYFKQCGPRYISPSLGRWINQHTSCFEGFFIRMCRVYPTTTQLNSWYSQFYDEFLYFLESNPINHANKTNPAQNSWFKECYSNLGHFTSIICKHFKVVFAIICQTSVPSLPFSCFTLLRYSFKVNKQLETVSWLLWR